MCTVRLCVDTSNKKLYWYTNLKHRADASVEEPKLMAINEATVPADY